MCPTHIPHAKLMKQLWLIEFGHECNKFFEVFCTPVELQLGFRPVCWGILGASLAQEDFEGKTSKLAKAFLKN